MAIKYLKISIITILLFTLIACPMKEDCSGEGLTIIVPDLVQITPFQEVYNQGDTIVFSVEIPRIFQGVDLLNETGDREVIIVCSSDFLFVENNLNFIKGYQGEYNNWFKILYNEITEKYELEIIVTLNKLGNYEFFGSGEFIDFLGDNCNNYYIETTIDGVNSSHMIEFRVE